MTRRIPPRISPRLYPLPKPDMRTVIRANGAAEYRHNRSRGYTQKYIPCLSLSLSPCQALSSGVSSSRHIEAVSGPRRWSLASMTGAHRTTGHCPLSPCPRLLFSFSPPQLAPPPFPPFLSAGDFARLPSRISFPPPTFLFRFSRLANPGRELTF